MATPTKHRGFKVTRGDATGEQLAILVPTDYRVLHLASAADENTDWAVANPTHPTLYIHSETTPATDYISLSHDGTDGIISVAGGTLVLNGVTDLTLQVAGVDEVILTASALSPATSDGNALGTTALMWGDLFLASGGVINFDNGNVTLTHSAALLTLAAGDMAFGVDGTGVDVTFYGDTASYKVWWDQNGDTNGAWYFGADDYGVDVVFRGQTASAALTWDASTDDLIWTGVARAILGTSGTPLTLTQGSPLVDIYSTCASTNGSNSVEPFYMKSTMTGAGGVGGRARFHMYTNVVLGGWSNALKGYAEYGASGGTTGLGSAVIGELVLSAGTSSGTYAPLESELVLESGALTGTATSFLYCNVAGADVATFNTNGFLFELGSGISDTAGGLFEAEVNTDSMSMTHVLRFRVGGTSYYLPANTSKTF